MVARYHPVKDHANLIAAAPKVLARHPDVRFVLVGASVDRKNVKITEQIKSLNITDSFDLMGEKGDVASLLPAFDVVVVPSIGEAFSNVLGEAMACGIVCVTTDVGDGAWIVGDTGKVVPARDPERLGEAIVELLSLPTERRRAIGAAARERIQYEFSMERMINRYTDLYRSLAG